MIKRTTPVPNIFFDSYLPHLSGAELKVLLIITRSTIGWVDANNRKQRKQTDWISGSQLQKRTGCSRRSITSAIKGLIELELIEIRDADGKIVSDPSQRKGKRTLYYSLKLSPPTQKVHSTWANFTQVLAQKMRITKETSY